MKVSFEKKEFLSALSKGGCFAFPSRVLPVLSCVRLSVNLETCIMSSCDERSCVDHSFPVSESDGCFAFCVPKSEVERFVTLMPDGPVSFDVDGVKNVVSVSGGGCEMCLPLSDADDFPLMSDSSVPDGPVFLESGTLSSWIRSGGKFLFPDDFRKDHENMSVSVSNGSIDVFFFGNSRLYHDSCATGIQGDMRFPLNRASFQGVLGMLEDDGVVAVTVGRRLVELRCGNTIVKVRMDEYVPLEYNRLLGYKEAFSVTYDKEVLLSVASRAEVATGDSKTGLLRITFGDGFTEFVSDDYMSGKSYRETVPVGTSGKGITASYQIKDFRLAVSSISNDRVMLCPSDGKVPCRVQNPDRASENALMAPFLDLPY